MPAIGAHLHLCLDGSEAPTSVHVADDGEHHPQGDDSGHDDVDVGLDREVLAKKVGSGPDTLKVLPATPVLYVRPLAVAIDFSQTKPAPIVRADPYQISPPPRGPPL